MDKQSRAPSGRRSGKHTPRACDSCYQRKVNTPITGNERAMATEQMIDKV